VPPLHIDGKAADQTFDADELLFRRVPKTHIEDGEVSILALPDSELKFEKHAPHCTSVVRSKYCVHYTDVLHPDCAGGRDYSATHAVCYWRVGDLANGKMIDPLPKGSAKKWDLFAYHDPLITCYAHTAICCCGQSTPNTPEKPPPSLRIQFRDWFRSNLLPYDPPQPSATEGVSSGV
jgi:hypothetical protein